METEYEKKKKGLTELMTNYVQQGDSVITLVALTIAPEITPKTQKSNCLQETKAPN
jgi:hypothetical protein